MQTKQNSLMTRQKPAWMIAVAFLALLGSASAGVGYPLRPVGLTDVRVTDGFWFDRFETNRLATLKTCLAKCNETPRIANFTNAANHAWGTFGGIPFDDSDVYKVMEGAAYILALHPNRELEDYVSWFIGQVAGAQEPDGYLYTARTLGHVYCSKDGKEKTFGMMGPTRWSNCPFSHELYNVGHVYEAAVAWYRATGRRDFLEIATKSANLVCRTFGPGEDQLHETSGHEEIELALCKLFQVTGQRKYLDQAKYFLDRRGHAEGRLHPECCMANWQDHLPVTEQNEAIGHAVRAGYLYVGMSDVAALTGDRSYADAVSRLWRDVVCRKLYLTGGIGARKSYRHPTYGNLYEAFNGPYDLPNDAGESYLETCAAIANILWNQRLFLSSGESKYVDVAELALHNGFLSGISLTGSEFFYPNPLASKGGYKRSAWFGCSCCPVNDVRMIPQVPSFAYATSGRDLYWNLFMSGTARIGGFDVRVKTDYPWSGKVELTVNRVAADEEGARIIRVRLPGWAAGRPVPSDLYSQVVPASASEVAIVVNGVAVDLAPDANGYLALSRRWKPGDVVTLDLPMPVRRIRANEKLAADAGRLAVMRGPILYCAEGADNGGKAYAATLPADATFSDARIAIGDKTFPALRASNGLTLIPYCLWCNRQPGNEMQCWFSASK